MTPPPNAPPPTSLVPPPPPVKSAQSAPKPAVSVPVMSMKPAEFTAPRIVITGVEGVGKTSIVAYAPGASIIEAGNETGYSTLAGVGRVPQIPSAHVSTWEEFTALLDSLIDAPPRLLGFDAMSGLERMCHEFVCKRDFNGDWSDKGFASFQKGYDMAVTDWLLMLSKLDRLHKLGTTIIILAHCKVKPFKNPEGPDFDRYVADVHEKTWAATHRWADAALFMKFETITDSDKNKRVRGIGTDTRILYTSRTDARDAKNRYGMPSEIEMPGDPAQMFNAIWQYIQPNKES